MAELYNAEFIVDWYQLIDSKVPFEKLERLVDKKKLKVEFPNNSMDVDGFRLWYEGQCANFTGKHFIENITLRNEQSLVRIEAIVTWRAVDLNGQEVVMYPNVWICLDKKSNLIVSYGCIDRSAQY